MYRSSILHVIHRYVVALFAIYVHLYFIRVWLACIVFTVFCSTRWTCGIILDKLYLQAKTQWAHAPISYPILSNVPHMILLSCNQDSMGRFLSYPCHQNRYDQTIPPDMVHNVQPLQPLYSLSGRQDTAEQEESCHCPALLIWSWHWGHCVNT